MKTIIKSKYTKLIPLTKLKLPFRKPTSLSTHFFHLGMRRCRPVASKSLLKRRTSSLTLCFASSSSAERLRRSACFRGPNTGSQWVLNRACSNDEEEHFTQLLQVPLLGAKCCAVCLTCCNFLFGRNPSNYLLRCGGCAESAHQPCL